MSHVAWRPLLLALWATLSVVACLLLASAQRQGERDVRERFRERAEIAARFTEIYARDMIGQQRRVAERELSRPRVSADAFRHVVDLFGYEGAALLDARGRALHVIPARPAVIGRNLGAKYDHLGRAVAGAPAISEVVRSAATGAPLVSFAAPFGPAHRRRVFSGAFDVTQTPLGAYLPNAMPLRGARVYLLDSSGSVVASSRKRRRRGGELLAIDEHLGRALGRSRSGYTADGREYASRPVSGTPWRLAVSVPRDELFRPLQGRGRYLPWLLWAGFVLGGFGCALLVGDLLAKSARLRTANDELDRMARTDVLTGIDNRREVAERLGEALAATRRRGHATSVLMIDVDRFKGINDTHGHAVGDEVLCFIARHVRDTLRAGDHVGRWGGEEFLVILPATGEAAAELVAERIREAVSAAPVVVDGRLLHVSVSIGAATDRGESAAALVARADAAMYAAKAGSRDAAGERRTA